MADPSASALVPNSDRASLQNSEISKEVIRLEGLSALHATEAGEPSERRRSHALVVRQKLPVDVATS